MFIQKNILLFSLMYMLKSSIIFASDELIIQQTVDQNTIQKIESWASIATDGSWQETKQDFIIFLEKIEQIRILAERNSFFNDDADDSDDEDESLSADASVSSDEEGETSDYTIGNNSINQLLVVNLIQIKK